MSWRWRRHLWTATAFVDGDDLLRMGPFGCMSTRPGHYAGIRTIACSVPVGAHRLHMDFAEDWVAKCHQTGILVGESKLPVVFMHRHNTIHAFGGGSEFEALVLTPAELFRLLLPPGWSRDHVGCQCEAVPDGTGMGSTLGNQNLDGCDTKVVTTVAAAVWNVLRHIRTPWDRDPSTEQKHGRDIWGHYGILSVKTRGSEG